LLSDENGYVQLEVATGIMLVIGIYGRGVLVFAAIEFVVRIYGSGVLVFDVIELVTST
jgi:hypothetical protein